jgi:hypothetical protein
VTIGNEMPSWHANHMPSVTAMAASSVRLVRCAIYTRKSTEHGLERTVVGRTRLRITLAGADRPHQELTVPWAPQQKGAEPIMEGNGPSNDGRNESPIQSIVSPMHGWFCFRTERTTASKT